VAIVPVSKKGNIASVSNYQLISVLNTLSKLFELVIHDHVSHYLKSKLNPCQHGFTKSKSTITNLVTYLDFITPVVSSQGQADAIYFAVLSTLSLIPCYVKSSALLNFLVVL
jgi:hypothetical protein